MKQLADYFMEDPESSTEHQLEHGLHGSVAIIPIIALGPRD